MEHQQTSTPAFLNTQPQRLPFSCFSLRWQRRSRGDALSVDSEPGSTDGGCGADILRAACSKVHHQAASRTALCWDLQY